MGQFRLGENGAYMDSIHLYNSGATGLSINMISCGASFVLDFKQNFPSDKYVKAFCAQLEQFGIPHQAGGVIPFITPGDALVKRKCRAKELRQ